MKSFTTLTKLFIISLLCLSSVTAWAGSGVYVRGAHNSWGATEADELTEAADGTLFIENVVLTGAFKIADASWSSACNWGANSTSTLVTPGESYTMQSGSNTNMIVAERTECERITVDLTAGTILITKKEEGPAEVAGPTLWPQNAVLASSMPSEVKVLSMNNSLIHYEAEWQDDMFNRMAEAQGVSASWTAHTNLGKSLDYHYDEGEGLTEAGTPSARMLVRTQAWSHIILQEQTAKPRNNFSGFRASIKRWVEYIRENCPNPNAVIILPINWAYNTDPFTEFNAKFLANYMEVAQEFGVVLCPVGVAYQNAYEQDAAILQSFFKDDRHPTPCATYLACCLEYATIYGVDPVTITWAPDNVASDVAATMRAYASSTWKSFEQVADHHRHTVKYQLRNLDVNGVSVETLEAESLSVNAGEMAEGKLTANAEGEYTITATFGGSTYTSTLTVAAPIEVVVTLPSISLNDEVNEYTENFDSMGGADVDPSTDAKTGIKQESTLPHGWRIERNINNPREVNAFENASETTMYIGGKSLASNAYNGTWNWGATGSADRAVGGLTTGVANGTRGINVMAHITNDGTKPFESIDITYDIEKYRSGNNPSGFTVQLYYSTNGKVWTKAGSEFQTSYPADDATVGFADVPAEVTTVSGNLDVKVDAGTSLFLAWNISVTAGNTCNGAPGYAIDNVTIVGNKTAMPEAAHYIYVDDQTSWDALALYSWGNDLEVFGAWPGIYPAGTVEVEGTTYKAFPFDVTETGNYNLIFNNGNNGLQAPDFSITEARDYYLVVKATGVTEVHASVEMIDADHDVKDSTIYDLFGRKVVNPTPGLYIQDNKKIMIK